MQKRVTIRLDVELFKRLEKLAGNRPIAEYCRDAISDQIKVDSVNHNLKLIKVELGQMEKRLAQRIEQIPTAVVNSIVARQQESRK